MSPIAIVAVVLTLATLGCAVRYALVFDKRSLIVGVCLMLATMVFGGSAVGFKYGRGMAAAERAKPEEKAAILSAALSEGMNAVAIALAGSLLFGPVVIVGEIRRKRRAPQ